jgi:hypothetical protein
MDAALGTMKRLSRRRQDQPITKNTLHVGMMFCEDALGTVWPLVSEDISEVRSTDYEGHPEGANDRGH